MSHAGPFEIPQICDVSLRELAKVIRPLFRVAGRLSYMKRCDPRRVAFTWAPKYDGAATGLEKIADIQTLHTWGYYGLFKPSIAEVIAQIPRDLLEIVVAFETIGPADADALNAEKAALHAGFHVATTTLYRRG